jgi:hypothetical protein
VSLFEDFMKTTLELILCLSVTSPAVLLIGSPSHAIDCIIVACLRRVQEWSFVSILGELRMLSGCRQFDLEQFIESFNPDIVDISQNTPDYLQIHMRLKDEEEKLLHRLEKGKSFINANISTLLAEPSIQPSEPITSESDVILGKLFFSNRLISLSPGTQFDPILSLINDKDDDD